MKKIAIIISLGLASLNAYSADVPVATDTGTITVKGSVYSAACTTTSTGTAATIAIPTTFAADYSKGDMSPQGTSNALIVTCAGLPDMVGLYLTVTGDADSTEPAYFKVADSAENATGIAIKLMAKSAFDATKIIDITPNQESVLLPRSTSANSTGWYYLAQAVAVADTVTSGNLATNLTWTARYN